MNWLFLRGLLREQRHWLGLPEVFEQTVPGAKVHCLDFPGIGTERHRRSPLSVAEIMADVRRRWLELRACNKGDWGLYSVSLGSMVGLTWAQSHPQDFARLVVTNTSVANLSPFYHRFDRQAIAKLPALFVARNAEERELAMLRLTTSGQTPLDAIARKYADFSLDLPAYRDTGLRQLFAGSRLRLSGSIQVPLLVLSSLGDALVSPSCSQAVARLFQAPLVSHPWAGHDLPLEDPAWVSEQIRDWVAR